MASRKAEMIIRSGRFIASNISSDIVIVEPTRASYYRILNSGDAQFSVVIDGNATAVSPGFSLDVPGISGITITAASGTDVRGIYDHLDPQTGQPPNHSGRFQLKRNQTPSPTTWTTIINMTGDTTQKLTYRIFNTGNHPISLRNLAISSLEPGQSFDCHIRKNGTRVIDVRSDDNQRSVSGVYELISLT